MRNTTNQNIIVHTSDTFAVTINFVDGSGIALDVTGASIVYSVYRNDFLPNLITKTSGANFEVDGSSIEVVLSHTDTIYSGNFRHKLVLTDGIGQVFTIVLGSIFFTKDSLSDLCITLTAMIDDTIFVPGSTPYMLDFSKSKNSQYIFTLPVF